MPYNNSVSLTAPTDYATQLQDIERRRKMAEMLQQAGGAPVDTNVAPGVKVSWTQGLAKALQSMLGAYQQQQLTQEQKDLVSKQSQSRSADLAKFLQASDPSQQAMGSPDQLGGQWNVGVEKSPSEIRRAQAQALLGSSDPELQKAGLPFASPPKPTELSEGATMVNEDYQPIARGVPKRVPPVFRKISVGDGTQEQDQQSLDNGVTWNSVPGAVAGPRFAKQIVNVNGGGGNSYFQAVQTPQGIMAFNARTGKMEPVKVDGQNVIGSQSDPTLQGSIAEAKEAGQAKAKRAINMAGLGDTIDRAESILSGSSGQALPTGSTVGTLADTAAGWVGASPSGAKEAQELKAIGGALTSKMPRMEGPQSDKDTQLYKEMAAVVGDSTIPRDRRLAALGQVKGLWGKYADKQPAPKRRDSDKSGATLKFDAQGNPLP